MFKVGDLVVCVSRPSSEHARLVKGNVCIILATKPSPIYGQLVSVGDVLTLAPRYWDPRGNEWFFAKRFRLIDKQSKEKRLNV